MNIQKYYDQDGNATHQVCRVLLSFQNNSTPWLERVQDAAKLSISVANGVDLHFMSAKLKQSDYSDATIWVMLPLEMPVDDIVYRVSTLVNNLGLQRIIATAALHSLDYLTSRKIDHQ